jgi:hypothetical protein
MSLERKPQQRLDRLMEQLRLAPAATPELVLNVVAECARLAALKQAGKAVRIGHLIEAGAWSDVALALIEIELPAWKFRRLIYDDAAWFCSLSRQPHLPVELDDTVDARHDVLPLAILSAFVEARRRVTTAHETSSTTVPQIWPTSGYAVCCDNFA